MKRGLPAKEGHRPSLENWGSLQLPLRETREETVGEEAVEGFALPPNSPPQAGSAAQDEFVYSHDTRLPAFGEKSFSQGLERRWGGLASELQ